MKHLKQFYHSCINVLRVNLVNFMGSLVLISFKKSLRPFWNRQLSRKGKGKKASRKNTTIKESSHKQSRSLGKTTLNSLENQSSFIITSKGELCHRALIGLDLNCIYESSHSELMFGYESK